MPVIIIMAQDSLYRSVTAAMFDTALNFRDVYMEYIPNYPIVAYRIDDEMANNPDFKNFVEVRAALVSEIQVADLI